MQAFLSSKRYKECGPHILHNQIPLVPALIFKDLIIRGLYITMRKSLISGVYCSYLLHSVLVITNEFSDICHVSDSPRMSSIPDAPSSEGMSVNHMPLTFDRENKTKSFVLMSALIWVHKP